MYYLPVRNLLLYTGEVEKDNICKKNKYRIHHIVSTLYKMVGWSLGTRLVTDQRDWLTTVVSLKTSTRCSTDTPALIFDNLASL